jgi:hypothetical protein
MWIGYMHFVDHLLFFEVVMEHSPRRISLLLNLSCSLAESNYTGFIIYIDNVKLGFIPPCISKKHLH